MASRGLSSCLINDMSPLGPNASIQDLSTAALECFNRQDDAGCVRLARWVLWQESNHGLALSLLAAVLAKHGRNLPAALDYARRGVAAAPAFGLAHYALGQACQQLGLLTEAIGHFRNACDLERHNAEFLRVLGLVLLQAGLWQEGWTYYERRPTTPNVNQYRKPVLLRVPEWRGEGLTGANLLVVGENGYGDQIQGLRFISRVLELPVARLMILVRPGLNRLLEYSLTQYPGGERAVALRDLGVVDASYSISLESLAHLFNANETTFPRRIPYLFAPPAPGDGDRGDRTLRVGIAWHGFRRLVTDAIRSTSLTDWFPLIRTHSDIRWVSLHQDDYDDQERSWITDLGLETPLRSEFDFLDTARVVSSLDLVISVDTAIAHLAGAMGKPVWLLNRASSEWRWGWKRTVSPWYPTMRIFNQQDLFDWRPALEEVEAAIARLPE